MSHRTNRMCSLLRTKWKPQHNCYVSVIRNAFQGPTLILLSSIKTKVVTTFNEISKNEI